MLERCPQLAVPAEVWEVIELADLYEKGLPPVAGGTLDQADAFLRGCRMYWNERERIRAEEAAERRPGRA